MPSAMLSAIPSAMLSAIPSAILLFSHTYCIQICAVLVPLNLLTTIATIVLVARQQSRRRVWMSCGFASLWAGGMVLHVASWLLVGVVMLPTFILLGLGTVCLGTNLWAATRPQQLRWLLRWLAQLGRRLTGAQPGPDSLPDGVIVPSSGARF